MPNPILWADAVLGFVSGIGLAVLTATVTGLVERRNVRRARIDDARFQIYMKLLDLHSSYFSVTTAELHREDIRLEVRERIRSLSWQIADQLRAADEVEYAPEILDVLLSTRYGSAVERSRAIDELLTRLGNAVNPRYTRAVRQISENNLQRLATGDSGSATTPALME